MSTAHLRDKLAVHRLKVGLVIVLLAALPFHGQAQLFRWARQHNMNYDDRKITYGFAIGLHVSSYQVKYSDKFVTKTFDTVRAVQPVFLPGFSLGFLVNYRINEFLD